MKQKLAGLLILFSITVRDVVTYSDGIRDDSIRTVSSVRKLSKLN